MEIDPPWPNKSVRRAKIYSTEERAVDPNQRLERDLFEAFPVDALCNENCLFLVWITNDPRCITSVM